MKQISIKILIGSVVAVLSFAAVIGNNNEPSPAENISEKQTEAGLPDSDSGSWFSAAPIVQAQEIIEMRTSNSKTWFLGNQLDGAGKYMWQGSVGDIHYKNNPNDPNEAWKDINNDIVASDREGYDYQMMDAGYKIYLKEKFNEGKIVRYEKQGEWLEMGPGELSWGDGISKQSISGPRDVLGSLLPDAPNEIHWPNAYGGKIDFKLIAKPIKLVKVLGIENFNHLPAIDPKIFPKTDNAYLELNINFEYSGSLKMEQKKDVLNFKNSNGEILWQFLKPNFWDSGDFSKNGFSDFNIIKEEINRIKISVRVPYNWLKQATFPVYIDPTATLNVAASADDVMDPVGGTFSTNSTGLNIGRLNAGSYWRLAARFTNVGVPQGATISTSSLTMVAGFSDSGSTVNTLFHAENVDNATQITSAADFRSRATTTGTAWDSIQAFTVGNAYTSPNITAEVQAVINRAGWTAGNAINIYWRENGSSNSAFRRLAAQDNTTYTEPRLTIVWMGRPPGLGPSGGGFLMF